MRQRIVIKRTRGTEDWERLHDAAAAHATRIEIALRPDEAPSGTFSVASGGPTFTDDGLKTKFILFRVDDSATVSKSVEK